MNLSWRKKKTENAAPFEDGQDNKAKNSGITDKKVKRKRKNINQKRLTGKEKLIYYGIGTAVLMMLCWAFFQSLLLSVLLLPLLFVLEGKVAEESERKKDQKWEESFQRYLTDLDSNLRLGHSLERSTAEAINSSTAFEEEKWMISELEMNVYVADVFQKLAEKKKIESLRQFSSALSSALQSGSNLHELVQNSIFQIQKKIRMEAEIKSMLTKVKYESSLLTALVPMMMIYMKTLSPNFKEVMYGSLQGRFVMLVCLAIYLAASYLCYYMTQIDI